MALLVVAALPRLLLVGRQAIWTDEVFSLAMATGHSLEHPAALADPSLGDYVEPPEPVPARDLARYARHESPPADLSRVVRAVRMSDTSPPLYYLILHAWTRVFGTTDAALRWFSLACALGCVPVLWMTARQLGGIRSAVPACALFAVLPLSVYLSTEGRMYSLVWLAAATNLWATLRLSRRGGDLAGIGTWFVSAVVGLLTHYFFLFVWLPACVWLLLFPGRTRRPAVGALSLLVAAAATVWYVQIPGQLAAWRLTDGWLNWPPPGYHPVKFYLLMPYHFFAASGPWGGRWLESSAFALLWAAVAVAAGSRSGRAAWSRRWLLPTLVVAGAVSGVALFDLWRHTYAGAVARYVAGGLPAAVLLAGLALGRLGRWVRAAFLAAIAFEGMVGVRWMRDNDGRNYQPVDEAARWLAKAAGPSDLVIVHSIPSGVIGLTRYLEAERPGSSGPAPTMVSWVEQLGQRRLPEDIERLVARRPCVYLVRFHEVGAPAPVEGWLREHAVGGPRRRWEGVSVEQFFPRTDPALPVVEPTSSADGRW